MTTAALTPPAVIICVVQTVARDHPPGFGPAAFTVQLEQRAIDDLRARLDRSRFVARATSTPWAGGSDPHYLAELVERWQHFDWIAFHEELNSVQHLTSTRDGLVTHFVRLPARPVAAASSPALVLCHGWPSSFLELLPLAHRLSDPVAHGGPPEAARDVIVPSLPGFAFSDPLAEPATRAAMARHFHTLMTSVLGYEHYVPIGADIGGSVAAWMAALFPQSAVAVFGIHPPVPNPDGLDLSEAERAYLEAQDRFDDQDRGYSEMMTTRPDTVAAALIDSPVGLLAWLVDKLRAWSDCHDDIRRRWPDDAVLTLASLYWFTGCIGTSFRPYFDWHRNGPRPPISVPAGFTVSHEAPWVAFPRTLADRSCADIRYWRQSDSGGHFLPFEEPDALAGDVNAFLDTL